LAEVSIFWESAVQTEQRNHIMLTACYFGTYRSEYSRNQIMIEGLRRAGVTVIECHEDLWHGIDDRVAVASGGWISPCFWWRLLRAYCSLIIRYFKTDAHDLVIAGYPGQLDIFVARILCRLKRRPLVWDIFMSVYLIALERGLEDASRASVTVLRMLERLGARLPDMLILDTEAYVSWFTTTHNASADNFRIVPTGADDRVFQPANECAEPAEPFVVLYYGTFIPNHGVLYIIEAARLLADNPRVHFELVGTGPQRAQAQALADEYRLGNTTFSVWQDKAALASRIARAHICLGSFGVTPQSLMTVQNKVYEALASGRPVITGDSSAMRSLFRHKQHLYLCSRENPVSLAQAVTELADNPALCRSLAAEGHRLFLEEFTTSRIGERFKRHLEELLSSAAARRPA
jgi:glycosyltransferase involved in cell wall biosynthesis